MPSHRVGSLHRPAGWAKIQHTLQQGPSSGLGSGSLVVEHGNTFTGSWYLNPFAFAIRKTMWLKAEGGRREVVFSRSSFPEVLVCIWAIYYYFFYFCLLRRFVNTV